MKTNFVIGGAVAALAAALALSAPAQARENDRQDNHGWRQQQAEGNSDHQSRPARVSGGREQRAVQPQRAQAPQARQEQRTYAPQARQEQRGWASRAPQQQQQQQRYQAAQAQQAQRSQWASGGQRTERNRSYTDGGRNTTYRDANRDSGYRGGNRTYQGARGGGGQWDRNWRNNNRYDWQRYRSTNRNVYHVGRYYAPYRNYSYRRLGVGFYLDSLFFGQDYWIGDPGYYRLPDVYGPYRWVRYYDDAVLVDIYTGEVVDVIYDFFW